MAKLALTLFALFVLPAIAVAARTPKDALVVKGRVYCEKCQAGFETTASDYIAGAKVSIECKNRLTRELLYKKEFTTDKTGTYTAYVTEDHGDQECDAVLVSSPLPYCSTPSAGRDRARVILTRYNGIASNARYANNMGFLINEPMAGCTQILQQYVETEEDV